MSLLKTLLIRRHRNHNAMAKALQNEVLLPFVSITAKDHRGRRIGEVVELIRSRWQHRKKAGSLPK